MEEVNVIRQMAQYDFSTPVNITMIFEEDSNEDINNLNVLKEQVQNKNTESNEDVIEVQENTKTSNTTPKTKSNDTLLNDSVLVQFLRSNDKQGPEYLSNTKENTQIHNTVTVANVNNNGVDNSNNNQLPQTNDHLELSTYVKSLLDTVSEHLVVIINHHYNCYRGITKGISPDGNLLRRFLEVRSHFFDLSYITVVSLILPQENNEKFINKFIDNTVYQANRVFSWKCERKHVVPFFYQMIAWAKQKRKSMKSLELANSNNQAPINTQIAEPVSQINVNTSFPNATHPMNDAINQEVVSTDGDICLFSSGPPGKEINIHVSPNTLLDNYTNQKSVYLKQALTNKKKANKRKSSEDTQPVPVEVHKAVDKDYIPQLTKIASNCCIQNNNIYYTPLPRQPPPTYYSNQFPTRSANPPVYKNSSYMNQLQPTISQNMRNIHGFPSTPVYATQEQQYCTRIQGPPLSNITTNTASHNPVSLPLTGRCCMCGRTTVSRCSKCNKFSYCSALCQELDAGKHMAVCA